MPLWLSSLVIWKMMWIFHSFFWCSSSDELGSWNLKILQFPTHDLKKKSEQFPVACLAQLFLWTVVWQCLTLCQSLFCTVSGCVSAWQVSYHETQSMGVCVLQYVLSSRILCGLDDREEKWCSKRGSTQAPLGIWHVLSFTSLFVGAAPFAAKCWWRRVLRM